MSAQFTRDQAKIAVAKVLQTLGWHSINSSPLEILTDIMSQYLCQVSKISSDYANEFGYTHPNLDHLGLAFREMGISVADLDEYVKYVNFAPPPAAVPKYPVPKEDHLNFLKPGSKEVVTRPVHIHEHLPPMHPLLEAPPVSEEEKTEESTQETIKTEEENVQVFKKPNDITATEFKRVRREEEGSRPTREISSVMMTTSGFLSPAREGKLPEARTPIPPPEPIPPPPIINPEPIKPAETQPPPKKIPKMFNKSKFEKQPKKERPNKELFKPLGTPDEKVRKMTSKDINRLKQMKAHEMGLPGYALSDDTVRPMPGHKINPVKMNKALAAARLKTEKLNTTITPIPMAKGNGPNQMMNNVDKLFSQPDKKKVNILKKISVKNEKNDAKPKKDELKQEPLSPPHIIVDDQHEIVNKLTQLNSDITIEPISTPLSHKNEMRSPKIKDVKMEVSYYDDGSPPGTPSTPRTPEIMTASPPVGKERKKRKERTKTRKVKNQTPPGMFHGIYNAPMPSEMDYHRPKTPECPPLPAHIQHPHLDLPFGGMHNAKVRNPLQYFNNFGPGLIPAPMGNPLFPTFPALQDLLPPNFLNTRMPPMPNPTTFANFLNQQALKTEEPAPVPYVSSPSPDKPKTPEPASTSPSLKIDKKLKEHKKEKKDKLKKKNKKEKIKNKAEKAEKKKLKEEKLKDKEKIKKEKKEKRKEKELIKEAEISAVPKLTLKLGSPSSRPSTPDAARKLNIKPIVKKEDSPVPEVREKERETSPSLARISALVTGPPKQKNVTPPVPADYDEYSYSNNSFTNMKKKIKSIPKIKKEPALESLPVLPSKYIDDLGNEVWICPACGRQDDGSPMIGCDGCDAWYHWVCVGIQVPPDDNEDWYCRPCLSKKDVDLLSDKKKKRKRRDKKEL